jgi:hypothetical protein
MEKDINFVVYEHYTSDTNELFYIGEGRPDRPYSHRNRNRYWKFKVNKHGGFTVKIVAENITKIDAEKLEKQLIKEYKDKGIELTNLCDGTIFGTHWLIGKPKEIHPMYGKKRKNPILSEWNKQHRGEFSPVYGKKRPDLSERNKSGNFKRFSRKIMCVETGIIYNSIKEATISMGKDEKCKSINKHLSGYRKYAFGYHWIYID